MDGWMELEVSSQLQTTETACESSSKHPQSALLYTYLNVVVVLVRHGLLMHYCKDYNLLLHALTVLAVTVTDPACPRAGIDGTATTTAALVSVSHTGRKLVQCAAAEVR